MRGAALSRVELQADLRSLRRQVAAEFPNLVLREFHLSSDDEDSVANSGSPQRLELRRSQIRPNLFAYQVQLVEAMTRVVQGRSRALLALPTGGGKTRTAVASLLAAVEGGSVQKCVWLAPSIELLDQAFDTLRTMWALSGQAPDLFLTRRADDVRSDLPTVFFTTPQAMYSRARRGHPSKPNWDLVIFDEAHQLGARTFRSAAEALVGQTSALIGLSATPGRVSDDETEDLVLFFGGRLLTSSRLGRNPVDALQRLGVLARIDFPLLDAGQSEASRLIVAVRKSAELVERGGRVLVFTQTVAGAVVFAEASDSLGLRSGVVHSKMSPTERASAISRFGTGQLDVLANQRLLATGYDCPAISDVVLVGRVSSPILFEQMVGRAARGPKTGGSRRATVWSFDDHLALHGLPRSYYRYSDFDWAQTP